MYGRSASLSASLDGGETTPQRATLNMGERRRMGSRGDAQGSAVLILVLLLIFFAFRHVIAFKQRKFWLPTLGSRCAEKVRTRY
jgi:hypothetical protein